MKAPTWFPALACLLVSGWLLAKSIEEKVGVHRLSTTMRAPYDAFVYVNRIPDKSGEGESSRDFAGRIFGRLANQEGRVLVKLPKGMDRLSYLGFKTFLRSEEKAGAGNCVACHLPSGFSDFKKYVVVPGGPGKSAPSLRNMKGRKVDIRKVLLAKISVSEAKRSGMARDVDAAYAEMFLSLKDLPSLEAFLNQLNDVPDTEFRGLILNARVLDTSGDIE